MKRMVSTLTAVFIAVSLCFLGAGFAKDAAASGKAGKISPEEFNKISENVKTALDHFPKADTGAMLKIDVTYQPSLPAKISPDLLDSEEAGRYAVGVYVADSFYAALHGKTEEMSQYLLACKKIIDDGGVRNIIDFERMNDKDLAVLENPGSITEEDIGRILAKVDEMLPKAFKGLAADPQGIDPVLDVSFGMAVETLYLIAQVVLQSDGAAEALTALANEKKTVKCVLQLLDAIAVNDYLKTICEADEKRAVLGPVLALFQKKSGSLTVDDAKTVLDMVAPVRQQMVKGQLKGHDHEHDHAS